MEPSLRSSGATATESALLSDAEVVERVCAGETPLFEVLMRRYNQRIYRCVRSILRDEAEVEDVMQQAYLAAFGHLGEFEGRSSVAIWLTRIAVNEALSRQRTRGRFIVSGPDQDGEDAMSLWPSAAPDPEQRAIAHELGQVIETAVDALPTSYRTVFVLREVEGLSTVETAEALGVAEPVVKTRLHRAKAQLREQLYALTQRLAGEVFPFGGTRCDRVVAAVLARLPRLP
ncbi:MAG TPA: RNA polymerase sigma factor [Myxococcota bacterium]|nr:RNA polymerase sigma factor [Myxococcota bacterium]